MPITYTGLSKSLSLSSSGRRFACLPLLGSFNVIIYHIFIPNEQCSKTPLLIAVIKGHVDVAGLLLESGSDVHEQDK